MDGANVTFPNSVGSNYGLEEDSVFRVLYVASATDNPKIADAVTVHSGSVQASMATHTALSKTTLLRDFISVYNTPARSTHTKDPKIHYIIPTNPTKQ